ncbi:MAG TPA: alkaline phosphatase family protein [Anaerolineales bacterium]|nr:alkaline phosphatase family protein [Anaerolineales bacterium]HLO33730.1 alkaline phosphatase family protein [Anaerolineales bacterium]
MKFLKKSASLFLLLNLVTSVFGLTKVSAIQTGNQPNTPIQHFIVVMQQNHTFDNYFGTYPGANGIPKNVCLPTSLADQKSTTCIAPFKITNEPITDLSHSDILFRSQYQNGQMNGFVDALDKLNQDGRLSMGHFDDTDIPYYWNLADQFVLFDNYFSSAHTGSITNRMFWVSGRPGDASNRIPEGGFGNIPTIFDRLQERGISWKFYIRDYDPNLNYRSLKELDYLPPQVQWVPLLAFDRFLDNPELSSHIVDLDEYYTDLEKGTLPAVSYVLLLGATEHPISDPSLGEQATRTMLQLLMQSSLWKSSAFFLTYDDWGGWYDHVPPPQVDDRGYGFRVPAMLVSPYARTGLIDHTLLDHTSILKFIEENWDIPPLAVRDAKANNFTSAFDFSAPPRPPILISSTREAPEPRVEPRRIVIYAAYGAAMLFACLILLRAYGANTKENLPHLP